MKRSVQNLLSMLGADVFRRLLGFVTFVVLARRISPDDFGVVNLGFTVLTFGLLVSSAGLGTFGARELARGSSSVSVESLLGLRLVLAALAFILIAASALLFIHDRATAWIIVIFALSLFVQALSPEWYFQGKEEMRVIAASRSIAAAVWLAIVLTSVRSPETLSFAAWGALAADVVGTSVLIRAYRKQGARYAVRFDRDSWPATLRQAAAIGAGSLLGSLSVNLVPLIIALVLSTRGLGIYSSASKIVVVLLMLDRVFGTVFLPAASRRHAASPEELTRAVSSVTKWIVVCAWPLCLGGMIVAPGLIALIFGSAYFEAGPVLQILVWYFFVTMLHTVNSSGLIAAGEEKIYSRVMIVSFLLYAGLVFLGTRVFGLEGAAAGLVLAETVTLLMTRSALQRVIRPASPSDRPALPQGLARVVLSGVGMATVLLLLPGLHVVLAVLLGAAVYCALLFGTKAVTGSEVSLLFSPSTYSAT